MKGHHTSRAGWAVAAALAVTACVPSRDDAAECSAPASNGAVLRDARIVVEGGGRVDWSASRGLAYDRRGEDGCYDVWTARPDGAAQACLTCSMAVFPGHNVGQPAWSPDGRFLVVQVESGGHTRNHCSTATHPGAGVWNDLWVIHMDTQEATLLLDVTTLGARGSLHPHFSSDGAQLSFSLMFEGAHVVDSARTAGVWKLAVGTLTASGNTLQLDGIRQFQPGADVFYENHGFSPDGQRLIFTSNLTGDEAVTSSDIHTLLVATGVVDQHLTTTFYNEHAHYAPDGTRIMWMSNRCNPWGGTDYWLMAPDGTLLRRVTRFNDPDSHQHQHIKTLGADFAWSPDGRQAVVHTNQGSLAPFGPSKEDLWLLTLE